MRWLRYLGWGVVLLLAGGAIFQAIASSRTLHHPPGKLIDVGGYRMHLNCAGQGAPAVILDSGWGDSWLTWTTVQPQIAAFTEVCSYDRAGMGWSDPSPHPRTSRWVAEELHTLLHAADVHDPYVLVGHSLGGMNVRAYTDRYRQDVAGLVLVDSAHPDQGSRLPKEIQKAQGRAATLLAAGLYTMPFGFPRLLGLCPPGSTAECAAGPLRAMTAEYDAIEASFDEVRPAAPLGDLPLRVLSRDPAPKDELMKSASAVWEQLQQELATWSTNSRRTVATGCGHYIHRENPKLVIDTIGELVRDLRAGAP